MKYIHAILIYDGIYDCKGIQALKVEFDRLESANFVQVLCKHFSKIYISFSKVISSFLRKCLFFSILAFFTRYYGFLSFSYCVGVVAAHVQVVSHRPVFCTEYTKNELNRKI